jgi:hypothetical protein
MPPLAGLYLPEVIYPSHPMPQPPLAFEDPPSFLGGHVAPLIRQLDDSSGLTVSRTCLAARSLSVSFSLLSSALVH